ncbi:MAG: MFS transporter [Kiritimatiellae bacterium]|nr:MFS transporter [Kiritimatiellia bacterium]
MQHVHSEPVQEFEHDRHMATGNTEPHNMRCGIIHGAFFHMATAFADPYAILPLFLAGFTHSRALIGLVVSLVEAVGVVPQIGIAGRLRHRPNSARSLMMIGIWSRCAVWGALAVLALAIPNPGGLVLILFMAGVSIYALGGGVAVLPLRQVISSTIAPEHRSSFFGWRLFTGGLLAAVAGVIVKGVLGSEGLAWPRNYGLLFLMSFAALGIAYTAMSHLRFPRAPSVQAEETPAPLFRELRRMWREFPILKRLIMVRWLSGGLILALPFLTLYATREIGVSLAWVGIFVVAQRVGAIASNLVWMPLGNRRGTRLVILSGLGLAVLGLGTILVSETVLALTVAFALAGSAMSALVVGFNGYILELGTPDIRPLLFALEGTLLLPMYFMPLLGGWLADTCGYRPLVLIGIAFVTAGLIAACALCEPRTGDPACGPCKERNQQKERSER